MAGPGYNYLACGCRFCTDTLTREFAAIVFTQIDRREEEEMESRAYSAACAEQIPLRSYVEAMSR